MFAEPGLQSLLWFPGLEERIKVIEISKLLAGSSLCTESSCRAGSYAVILYLVKA